jgi:hypothetical protein
MLPESILSNGHGDYAALYKPSARRVDTVDSCHSFTSSLGRTPKMDGGPGDDFLQAREGSLDNSVRMRAGVSNSL